MTILRDFWLNFSVFRQFLDGVQAFNDFKDAGFQIKKVLKLF